MVWVRCGRLLDTCLVSFFLNFFSSFSLAGDPETRAGSDAAAGTAEGKKEEIRKKRAQNKARESRRKAKQSAARMAGCAPRLQYV